MPMYPGTERLMYTPTFPSRIYAHKLTNKQQKKLLERLITARSHAHVETLPLHKRLCSWQGCCHLQLARIYLGALARYLHSAPDLKSKLTYRLSSSSLVSLSLSLPCR